MRTNILQAKKALLALFVLLMPLLASAHDFEVGGIYYNITSEEAKQAEVTYKGNSCGSYFDEYFGSITLPATVTHNGVQYSVTSIGEDAFFYCKSLTAITIPENSQLTSIGVNAFEYCSSLTTINIPESVTSIENSAFYNCSKLTSITIPENSQLTSIGNAAFYGCSSLTAITIPESVTSIAGSAFSGCSSLTDITIPEGVTSIGDRVFYGCSSLTDITIPEGVTSIREYAFKGCSSLTSITCHAVTPPTIGDNFTFGEVDKSIPVYVPAGSVAAYQMAEGWSDFKRFEAIKTSVSNITLSQSSITLTEGASITLTAIVTPEDADDTSVTWSSSNEDVVMVSSKGKVVALAAGTATITATANDGSGVSASCEVTVTPASYVTTFLIDGEQFYTQTLTRGSTITLPNVPAKEGYTFSGWGEIPETMPANDLTISGTFIANKYLVTFKIGDEVIAANTLEYGAAIVAPEAPEKEGHTFNGWGNVAETVPASDVTYEGSYSINSYTLTYVVDGEVVLTLPILYGGSIPSLKEPTKEGHTFSGWGEVPETMPANDVTYEGSFTINSYTLTYIVDGKEYNVSTVVYGTALAPLAEPVKEGYTFSGWNEIPATMPADNVVIYGTFAVNKYLVTFKIGNEVIAANTLEYGAAIVAPEAPEKEGHTFNGWGNVAETVPASDVTYEGSFSINSYTLTYVVDGEAVLTLPILYGGSIPSLKEPTKEGYTFSGWSKFPETMPAEDLSICGTFTINKYFVTFKIGDEVIAANTLEYGAAIVAPEAPEKEGHTFNGWGDVAETVPASDVTYEGSYSINSYTLTYVVDGEAVLTLPILYGGSIPSLKEPTKEGYTFSGWSEVSETMPAKDVTIEGTFTQLPSVSLTINQADNGYVKQHMTEGTVCTFTIEAAEGWKIHTVTFNGEDVTSQLEEGNIYTTPEMFEDAVLNIAYEQEVPEGVENAHARAIKVRGLDNTIHISGLAEDTTVTLYTTDGVMVAHQQSSAGEAKFTVDTNQVYLVHIGDKVVKIGM